MEKRPLRYATLYLINRIQSIYHNMYQRCYNPKSERYERYGGSGLLQKSCLTFKELDNYLLSGNGYAIHITNLEIFDKPKEISEFWTENKAKSCSKSGCPYYATNKCISAGECHIYFRLTCAPQSYCFIEID